MKELLRKTFLIGIALLAIGCGNTDQYSSRKKCDILTKGTEHSELCKIRCTSDKLVFEYRKNQNLEHAAQEATNTCYKNFYQMLNDYIQATTPNAGSK